MTKLYKDGDRMGISTDAASDEQFLSEISTVLGRLEQEKTFENDWEFQLSLWLPQIVDLCCKLKGYKTEMVTEQRLLFVGRHGWAPEIAEIDPRGNVEIHTSPIPPDVNPDFADGLEPEDRSKDVEKK